MAASLVISISQPVIQLNCACYVLALVTVSCSSEDSRNQHRNNLPSCYNNNNNNNNNNNGDDNNNMKKGRFR